MSTAETIRRERLGLVERLSDLSPEQWDTPSLCAGWSVRHVLAHLVTPFVVSKPQMLVEVLRSRGVAGAMDRTARRVAEQPPGELLALLEQNAASRFTPPGQPLEAPLTDIVVHGADIRWVLDDDREDWGDPTRLRPVLDYLVSPKARRAFVPRRRLQGVRLVADDQEWSHGDGLEIGGSSLALAAGVLGRAAAQPLLSGAGTRALTR
jgi:uncharacterized protein (TIGR03083 family)